MDIKGMYQEEAEEIAMERFGMEFYELPPMAQDAVYQQAEENIHDKLAAQADMLRDRIVEK